MAAGAPTTARSHLASSRIAAIASANPNKVPVDLWTTKSVAHKAHRHSNSSSNQDEQNEKSVTYVAGQKCYPCPRLLTRRAQIKRQRSLGGSHVDRSPVHQARLH